MFNKLFSRISSIFSKKLDNPSKKRTSTNEFKWYDADHPDNPFKRRILDTRGFTNSVLVAHTDIEASQKFDSIRLSDGRHLREQDTTSFLSVECDLVYPHNNEVLEGAALIADTPETRWNIYVYDQVFYFAHSKDGELAFKAYAEITDNQIRLFKIKYLEEEFIADSPEFAINCVHFIILTHLMREIIPYPILDFISVDDAGLIAHLAFLQFGKFANYGTKESILDFTSRLSKS